MAHHVVKILADFSGEPRPKADQFWHYVENHGPGPHTLCEGEFIEEIEDCDRKLKSVERGGITCPQCLEIIREIKDIKL